jgi:hypothetical protein
VRATYWQSHAAFDGGDFRLRLDLAQSDGRPVAGLSLVDDQGEISELGAFSVEEASWLHSALGELLEHVEDVHRFHGEKG